MFRWIIEDGRLCLRVNHNLRTIIVLAHGVNDNFSKLQPGNFLGRCRYNNCFTVPLGLVVENLKSYRATFFFFVFFVVDKIKYRKKRSDMHTTESHALTFLVF